MDEFYPIPPEPPKHPLARWRVPIAIAVGLSYGLITRMSWGFEPLQHFLGTPVSASYLFLTPFVLGVLVALVGMWISPSNNITVWGILMPLLAVTVGSFAAIVTGLEASFCVIVAFPILLAMAIFGGTAGALLMRRLGTSSHLLLHPNFYFSPLRSSSVGATPPASLEADIHRRQHRNSGLARNYLE